MIKIGVIGVGSIGANHARVLSELYDVELAGVVDINLSHAQKIASRYKCPAYKDYREIINAVDAVVLAVPTTHHFPIALECLKKGRDILIEKPITSTVEEAEMLISEATKKDLIIQVGHLERFNSGVSLISTMIKSPRFIESRRLSPFPGRSIDIDVTLDLMIHDIDIILSLVRSEISDIKATGSKILTDNIDIAYAWLEFEDGCIAQIVANRMANEKVRELNVFQHNSHLNLNYQTQEVSCYKKIKDRIMIEAKRAEDKEPLKEQLLSFIDCIKNRTQPVVSAIEGKKALKVALQISEMINNGNPAKY